MDEHTINTEQPVDNAKPLDAEQLAVVQERINDALKEGKAEVRFEQTEDHLGKENEATLVN